MSKIQDIKEQKRQEKRQNSKKDRLKYRMVRYTILTILTIAIAYFTLPAINIHSFSFIVLLIIITLSIGFIEYSTHNRYPIYSIDNEITKKKPVLKYMGYALLAVPTLFAIVVMIGNLFNGPMFRATDYAALIDVEEKSFEDDFYEIDTDQIPLMDRDTAQRLGNRRIGSMSDLVSQFVPSEAYTQINIKDQPYRVTPLEYAGFFRWLNNKDEGIPNYLQVDMVTGEVEVKDVEGNINYSTSEYFGRDVKRHLRKQYPTTIFKDPSFEVDDNGHPHYVATTYNHEFFFRQLEPTGVIVLDAVTGETKQYNLDNTPTWIDRVYSADLILEQLDDNGAYQNGFINSLFSKQGVTRTTDGYNYLSINDDIYLYTGVTSVNSDASNIGFYLVNMRTKDAEFYPVTSSDEYSAMASAEGVVQQMGYTSTFPILININDRPYYLSSLKDDSGLVRSYALVDAQNYQDVIVEKSIDDVINTLNGNSTTKSDTEIKELETEEELTAVTGAVEEISQAVQSGNTVYYFMINGEIYKADIALSDRLPFVEAGNIIEGEANSSNEFKTIHNIK